MESNISDVAKLEKELENAKKLKSQKEWEEYLNRTEEYLKSIVGKTLMKWYSNGRFVVFKVTGYKSKYYADVNGWDGTWHPSRWFELKCSKAIHCSVKDSSGKYFRPEVKYQNFQFNKITGKSKNKVDISKLELIDYENEKYTYLPEEVSTFGKLSYTERIPDCNRDLNDFTIYLREAPQGMWEDAKKIADENIMKTKLFWDKYESKIKNS